MSNLAERAFAQLPAYVPELIALIGQPKRTIAACNDGDPEGLRRAIAFVGITVAVGFVLQAPAIGPQGDFLALAASMAAFKVVAILLFSGVVWSIFRLVGGRGEYLRTLIAYIYMVSPQYLAMVVLSLIGTGFVRAYDVELGLRLRIEPFLFSQEPELLDAFISASPTLAGGYVAINTLAWAVFLAWFLACLGAFRALHGVSRLRSGIAGITIIALFWPFIALISFLSLGMFGSLAPPLH
jgi:hypothetical protein